jgi:replicative superfamily II helicase
MDVLDITRTKLLFSGIGVYQPELFSPQEMDFFLRKKDAFKFILSTPSIVYGTNISLSIIDIDKSFLLDSTKNTLYQLIGRAGRKGKSHSATVIVRDNRMLDMIIENNTRNIEAEDIERNYQNILH